MKNIRISSIMTITLLVASVLGAKADYALNWSSIDGGGSTCMGGVYLVSGTIGQPDAGAMSGANYALLSGFWAAETQAVAAPPFLQFNRSGNFLVFSWPASAGNYVLKSTSNLSSAIVWTTVPQTPVLVGANYTVTVPMDKPREFFMLARSP